MFMNLYVVVRSTPFRDVSCGNVWQLLKSPLQFFFGIRQLRTQFGDLLFQFGGLCFQRFSFLLFAGLPQRTDFAGKGIGFREHAVLLLLCLAASGVKVKDRLD